ncbi:MAG: aldehyde dehydrogenase family protein [Deltaproteobacteria bacterium]|nr:aldehyde dehydrogenase family protein [Deltaproteobacteria bacterium]
MQERPELKLSGALDLAPALESHKVKVPEHCGHYIDGALRLGKPETYFSNLNPSTGMPLGTVAAADEEEVDQAVKAARAAFPGWSGLSGLERGKYLFRIARRMQERERDLAVVETIDNGKPIRETRDIDVPLAAGHFFYYAGWADKLEYASGGKPVRPLGVAGQIVPWNFPILMLAWKLAPALATGNTCVIKPAETTPLSAMLLAEILDEVGLPKGVVNIVNGPGTTGAAIVNHPDIDKISFTGSTPVGRMIMKSIAGSGKKATMELGGKSANIVFADAALDQAVEGVVTGIFMNQGHVCCAGSRLLVEESIKDEFLARLKRRILTLKIGDPLDKNTDIGAINSPKQFATVQRYIKLGVEEGGTLWQGAACDAPDEGFWVLPTLLTDVHPSDTVVREEIFGPVLSVLTFRTPDEAVQKANNSEYGLAAGVWSEKTSKLFSVAHRLNAGVIWVNGYNMFDPASPFGGMRHSGFGREGGVAGLWPYMEVVR